MGHGEVREKLLDLSGTHRLRMPFVMEDDESPDPLPIGLSRAETVVLGADSHTYLLQEPGWLIPWGRPVVLDHKVLLSDNARKPLYTTHMCTIKNTLSCPGLRVKIVDKCFELRRSIPAAVRDGCGGGAPARR